MERHKIVQAVPEHIDAIIRKIRKPDLDEIWAACLQRPLDVLVPGLERSEIAMTGLVDGQPVCVWGVMRASLLFNIGTPWMVASRDLDRHAMKFLRASKPELLKLFGNYDRLENYVDARNTRSIRWLKWLGFTVDEPVPYGAFNLPFHRFWMENSHV